MKYHQTKRDVIGGCLEAIWFQQEGATAHTVRHSMETSHRYPHKKKSGADKSGDLSGHETSPNQEMMRLGNNLRNVSMLCRAVWAVAPSC
jgi:hypothetical protein